MIMSSQHVQAGVGAHRLGFPMTASPYDSVSFYLPMISHIYDGR